jgi:hypothetical protein
MTYIKIVKKGGRTPANIRFFLLVTRMERKPDLIVKLYAGETVVDESTDPGLWQRVLAEIRGITAPPPPPKIGDGTSDPTPDVSPAIKAFAKAVGVTAEEIVGGLDPTIETPFVHLNSHDWEALKRNTPPKGPGAVPPAVLAATALVLWQRHGGTPDVTLQTVRATLSTIDLDDPNASRSVGNCDWLQTKGSRVALNPSRSSAATRLLRAYCRREAPAEAA